MNSIQLEKNISLSNFTTWGIGGPAEWIAQPKNIEELGLKGFRFGGAEISKIHSNFIINANQASSYDVRELIKYVKKRVFDSYGILLETEVKQCGF